MRALLDGRFADAEQLSDEALQLGLQSGSRTALAMFSVQTFLIRKEQGRLNEIEEAHRTLAERFAEVPAYRCAYTLLCCELGHLDEAKREFGQLARDEFAGIPRDTNWLMPIVYLTEACVHLGDAAQAEHLYRLLLPYRDFNIVVAYGAASLGPASRYLGLLAATMSRWEEAERHFDESHAMCRRMGAKPWLAHTQADRAWILLARQQPGDREQAGELLEESLIIAEALGMDVLTERVRLLRAPA
jgi:tetratricopeptide (TPR) repeat protein